MLLDTVLLAIILFGLGLSVFALISECLSWRSHQIATHNAAIVLRALYQRTFKRTKLLVARRATPNTDDKTPSDDQGLRDTLSVSAFEDAAHFNEQTLRQNLASLSEAR
jgi:hypothetical protein